MRVALCNILDAPYNLRHIGACCMGKAFGLERWPEGKKVVDGLQETEKG